MKNILVPVLGLSALFVSCNPFNSLNIFNLAVASPACVKDANNNKELKFSWNYTGRIDRVRLTFAPNGKTPQTVTAEVNAPVAGLRVLLNESTKVTAYVNLVSITPNVAPAKITEPDPKQLKPMNIKIEALNTEGQSASGELTNIDVADCYVP